MGKLTVVTCDRCGHVDSEDARAIKVLVCGAGMELCESCRVVVLQAAGVNEDLARAYVSTWDGFEGFGPKPSLQRVLERLEARHAAQEERVGEAETPAEQALSEPAPPADDVLEATTTGRRKTKVSAE